MQFDKQITISSAGSRKATQWPAQTLYWSEMVDQLKTARRGTETLSEYLKLPKTQQDELKDVGGFVAGTLAGNRRKDSNVTGRDVITLDLDNIPAGGTSDTVRRLEGLGCAYAVYSTRKHEEGKPRLRVLVPLNRTATADEYEPLARKLASIIGMSLADPTTFQASRLMYWPSICADSQYVFHYGDKPFLHVDGLLATYGDWCNISEWPVVPGAGQTHVRMAAKQGNPTEKRGVVGAFCRQFDIHSAIEKFLPGVYLPTDDGRYTFVGGSTVGGAVIYEDGNFLYSHHATDPCSSRLVNAFDLVRLHKFGEEDDEAKPDTPVNKLPSFTQMSAFALNDAGVANLLNQERYEQAIRDFGESPTVGQTAGEDDYNWIQKLKISPTTGSPLKSIENTLTALEGDPNLKGKIRMDVFADAVMGTGPFPWAPREEDYTIFRWTEMYDDPGLRGYLEKILGYRVKDIISDALVTCAAKNRFNPVMDYLNNLKWDGVRRLDTLFVDYLGAADTPYTRAVTRKSFTAAVARVMVPGCKYDTMPVLNGGQGIGKTTLVQKMGKSWFSNSIETFEGKDAAELLQGVWIVEVGEMNAYKKSDLDTIKGFLSRTEDHYRAAYARKTEKHPRRCVFFGTSNRSDYLKDPTGGRRFWPIDCGVQQPTKSVFINEEFPDNILLDSEVDQLWAEAVLNWRMGEALILTGELAEEAKRQQESHSEQDPRESLIRDFVERKVPIDWQKRDIATRKLFWSGEFGRIETPSEERDRICAAEVFVECLGGEIRFMKRSETMAINDILEKITGWKKQKNPYRYGPYGLVKGGYVRE